MKIFESFNLGDIPLSNRIVMAPMTRSRAIDNVPNVLMAEYYSQRATAGLIITEGTAPSPNGLGYPRIPGIFSKVQVAGWKKVTDAVHDAGGKIFIQLMHTGRVSHPDNMPVGAEVLAPSAIRLSGKMYTDSKGMQAYPVPIAMTMDQIKKTQDEYVLASLNAIKAGFDGVELHGANGYLIDQFINPSSNTRNDAYGGTIENRNRFTIEVARKVSQAIGTARTGIRLSPYGVFNDMKPFAELEEQFSQLAQQLGNLDLAYIHIVDHSSMGAPAVPDSVKSGIKKSFGRTIIVSGGLDREKAEDALADNRGELVAFGKPFISNPDLVERMKSGSALSEADQSTFYTPGSAGYTDYPYLSAVLSN